MAFLRFSRDKRGYEHFYLIEPTNRRGKARPTRLLYWFRTPPNIKVGRRPFDADIRRALETHNPDVTFDWPSIVDAPIPPVVDTERWRERRRVERATRQEAAAESDERNEEPARVDLAPVAAAADLTASVVAALAAVDDDTVVPEGDPGPAVQTAPTSNSSPSLALPGQQPGRGRRRRRRGRRGQQQKSQGPDAGLTDVQKTDVQDPGEPERSN